MDTIRTGVFKAAAIATGIGFGILSSMTQEAEGAPTTSTSSTSIFTSTPGPTENPYISDIWNIGYTGIAVVSAIAVGATVVTLCCSFGQKCLDQVRSLRQEYQPLDESDGGSGERQPLLGAGVSHDNDGGSDETQLLLGPSGPGDIQLNVLSHNPV